MDDELFIFTTCTNFLRYFRCLSDAKRNLYEFLRLQHYEFRIYWDRKLRNTF